MIMGILVDVDTEHNIKSMMGIIVSVVNNCKSHIYTEWLLWWLIIASRVNAEHEVKTKVK